MDPLLQAMMSGQQPQQLAPGQANGPGGMGPQDIQAALARMSPQDRAAMFQPYKDEQAALGEMAQPQHHVSPTGALLGGIGNGIARGMQGFSMGQEQHNAQALLEALYGSKRGQQAAPQPTQDDEATRQALAQALLQKQSGGVPLPGAEEGP